jgi:hypothetical protein
MTREIRIKIWKLRFEKICLKMYRAIASLFYVVAIILAKIGTFGYKYAYHMEKIGNKISNKGLEKINKYDTRRMD